MKFLYDAIVRHGTRVSGQALEIGVYKACSTIYLSKACLRIGVNKIFAMDLFTGTPGWKQTVDTFACAQKRLRKYHLHNNVELVRAHSQECAWQYPFDVFHLDGDHDYQAVLLDIRKYLPFLAPGGIVIFDDYDSKHLGVMQAVNELLGENEYDILARHFEGPAFGSLCLKRR